ncbi:MAG: DUF3644 domain-containing protein [Caldisericia bacterium]|nr:DUF3644 domain-containing protein [Caldisericia bacterium]
MIKKPRTRTVGSVKNELIKRSKEAALTAIQVFNNPNIMFKSETFIVIMMIGWTYLLHAYYRDKDVEYRYYEKKNTRKKFKKTKNGTYKYWELGKCIRDEQSPIDKNAQNNLEFLLGFRHEIVHQMTTKVDDYVSAKFQACCLNFNRYIKSFFGDENGIDSYLSFSLQLSSINTKQEKMLIGDDALPKNIYSYINRFEDKLSDSETIHPDYSYKVKLVQSLVNNKGQADTVIEYMKPGDEIKTDANKVFIKGEEKKKYTAKQIVIKAQEQGYPKFKMYQHILLWKKFGAKNPNKGYGYMVAGKDWRWYEKWLEEVLRECEKNSTFYRD